MKFFSSLIVLLLSLSLFSASASDLLPASLRAGSGTCNIENVCFAVDQSGSIDNTEYEQEREFIVAIADAISRINTNVFYSATAFSTSVRTMQSPTRNLRKFTSSVRKPRFFNRLTNIRGGLQDCFDLVKSKPGTRVIVLVTDGRENVGSAEPLAQTIKDDDVAIVSVGIGVGVSEPFLRRLATLPEFYISTDFPDLLNVVEAVTKNTCDAVQEILRNPNPCADFCRFTFCLPDGNSTRTSKGPRLLFRGADSATFPFICSEDPNGPQLGRILKTGAPQAAIANTRPRKFVPIHKFCRADISPPIGKRDLFIRTLNAPAIAGKYSFARRAPRGNQQDALDDICVIFPLKRFELIDGRRTRTVNSNAREDCFAFRGVAGRIIVQLSWDSSDDFDLAVTEPAPRSFVLNKNNANAPSGGRHITVIPNQCGVTPAGREQVTYRTRATPVSGRYGVEVRHFKRCRGAAATNWNLSVVVNGITVLNESGSTRVGRNRVVFNGRFNFP